MTAGLARRLMDEGASETTVPIKPGARCRVSCFTLEEMDLERLEKTVQFGNKGLIVSDSEDTACEVLSHLSRKFGDTHEFDFCASPYCHGYYLVGYQRKQ